MIDLKTLSTEQLIKIIKHLEQRLWDEGVSGNYYYAGRPTEEEFRKEIDEEYQML